jgi:hypothetical protein
LKSCGVGNWPSSANLAELLVKSSQELWDSIGVNKKDYLSALLQIAEDFTGIDINLIAEMKEAPILVAIKKGSDLNSEENDLASASEIFIDEDPTYQRIFNHSEENDCYYLASASEIFIDDDPTYQRIFNPLTAPKELEQLYKVLSMALHNIRETNFFFY